MYEVIKEDKGRCVGEGEWLGQEEGRLRGRDALGWWVPVRVRSCPAGGSV